MSAKSDTSPSHFGEYGADHVKGYVPQSLDAPHSSLNDSFTWVGMGLFLAGIAVSGIAIFGAGAGSVGSQDSWTTYVIIGVVAAVILFAAGIGLIGFGRRKVLAYRKANPGAH